MLNNRWMRRGLLILGTGLILILVFGVGFFIGRWSVFTDGRAALSRVGIGGHGAIGKISSMDGRTLALETREGATQIVLINDATIIERASTRQKIALSDLQVGNRVAVVGAPNAAGQIVAKIISLFVAGVSGTPTRPPGQSK